MIDNNDEVEIECAVCLTGTHPDDLSATINGDAVCNDCVRICNRCDDVYSSDDEFQEVNGCEVWCMSCVEQRAYWCDSCQAYTTGSTCYIRDRNESWCEDCIGEAYYCDDCDEYYADGCDSGHGDDENSRVIHDYSYRPDVIFHSTDKNERLFFGIEIEVEAYRNLADASNYAYQLEQQELAYLKHDGSLSCGFEVVTHPMSHDFFKNEASDFFDVIETLRSQYKVKSWDTNTCGLHIHISRSGFNSGAHMHRFLNLVYSNQELYEKLAGRSSDQWAKFTDIISQDYVRDANGERTYTTSDDGFQTYNVRTTRSFRRKLNDGGYGYNSRGSDRYSAVNCQNNATLEMRIFRGTVNTDTIKSHIDLAHASVEYTRTLTANDVINGALTADSFMWYIFEHEELYPQLVSRIDRLIPTVSASRQNESV